MEVLRRLQGAVVKLELVGAAELRPGIDDEVFRIAQEALANAVRHSGAESIGVRLEERGETLALTVSDDGVDSTRTPPPLALGGSVSRRWRSVRERSAGRSRSSPRLAGGLPWRWRCPVARIRVLIADDHAVVRQGLRTFLELQEEIEVVGDAADGEAAVSAARSEQPDVVLMDLVMPGVDGVEATRRIVAELPETRVLALTSFLEDDKVLPAVRAGATGYLLKDVEPGELVRAIRTVHEGGALLHPAVTGG